MEVAGGLHSSLCLDENTAGDCLIGWPGSQAWICLSSSQGQEVVCKKRREDRVSVGALGGGGPAGADCAVRRDQGVNGAVREPLPSFCREHSSMGAGMGELWEIALGMNFHIPADSTGQAL